MRALGGKVDRARLYGNSSVPNIGVHSLEGR